MKKRTLPLLLAAILGAVLGLAPLGDAKAESGSNTSVYTQPGDHLVNGRYWKTECEKYSTTVVRCTTNIWGTKIVPVGGTYMQQNGWVFNNLTYLPSDRAAWASNPLGKNANWTAKDGRRWKTECDTATTGANGCRSYALTTVVQASGSGYKQVSKWMFNNIVQFSTSDLPPVTSIPAAVPPLSGVPVESSSKAQKVVEAALSKVGSSYRYATSGPSSFDCSGLTSYAYRQIGVSLPRSSGSQVSAGTKVSTSALKPGDLVFYYSPISHVGIYIGNGQIVDAANPRTGVRIASLHSMPLKAAVRVVK